MIPQVANLFPYVIDSGHAMLFVDGENLAIRYGNMLKARGSGAGLADAYVPDVLVWKRELSFDGSTKVLRRHYYTATKGDEPKRLEAEQKLKDVGIEAPHVFHKHKEKGSKQVDITLATDMLLHACHKHYHVAILVAGDEDYVPLVKAVQREGALVWVWFVADGISPNLVRAADRYFDLGPFLFSN